MKVSDLTSDKQKTLATETGKRLARMVNDIQLPPPKRVPKFSFKDFAIPQPMMETDNYDPWKHQEYGDSVRKQRSWSHQLDVLIHKLMKYNAEGWITVESIPDYNDGGKYDFAYRLRTGNDVKHRTVYISKSLSSDDQEYMTKQIRGIVDRINQIFGLGGAYSQ